MNKVKVYSGTTIAFDPQWFKPKQSWYWISNNYPDRSAELEVVGVNTFCYGEVVFIVKNSNTTWFPEPRKRISLKDTSLLSSGEYYLNSEDAKEICRVSRNWECARGSNIPIHRAISIRNGVMSY